MSYKFSLYNRNRKLRYVLEFIKKHNIENCLIVGATPLHDSDSFENLIEIGIFAALPQVIVSGLEDNGGKWGNWVQADGRELPFPDKSFDLVFSNAVIEHVGNEKDQDKFVREHSRVGKKWILTTPKRLFLIESHTQKIFVHMRRGWTNPLVSRLLSKKDLIRILPSNSTIRGKAFSPTFICHN